MCEHIPPPVVELDAVGFYLHFLGCLRAIFPIVDDGTEVLPHGFYDFCQDGSCGGDGLQQDAVLQAKALEDHVADGER